MPTYSLTSLLKLRYPTTGNLVQNFQAIIQALASDVDAAIGQSIYNPGDLKISASSAVPTGWLQCDGSAVSRTTYANLFAALDTIWGNGDGSSTFNLPDYRGRTIVGSGSGTGLTARTLASHGGEEAHQLSANELAEHFHTFGVDQTQNTSASGGSVFIGGNAGDPTPFFGQSSYGGTIETSNVGANQAHNTMQPFAVCTVLVKT